MKLTKYFLRLVTFLGSLLFYFIVLVILISFSKDKMVIILTLNLLITMALCLTLRVFYKKDRPVKQKRNNFLNNIDANSFPSAHAIRITLLAFNFNMITKNLYIKAILILLLCLVLYSRIYLKKHDSIDVIAGISIAILTSVFIWWLF